MLFVREVDCLVDSLHFLFGKEDRIKMPDKEFLDMLLHPGDHLFESIGFELTGNLHVL